MKTISAAALKPFLTDGQEIAFLDVREHGQYGEGHPFFCVNLPYSRIEDLPARLVPNKAARCVLLDDGDGVAARAAAALARLGYSDVTVLEGGAPAWVAAGYTLFKGVNVPSKAFGELVEHELGTVSISAEELKAQQAAGGDLLVLDGRSEPEFHKMSLPGAQSCPNAELGYRLPKLAPDPATPVVINCAGRTRSIIGAQTLTLLGVPNPVVALRNGTQGWRLAGFDLVQGATPAPLPMPDAADLAAHRAKARALIADYALAEVDPVTLAAWQADATRTTYLFDVRSAAEFVAGHVPQARSAPGGQLVQATDEQLAVRNARLVLSCDTGLRAATTAIWLAGMGHEVYVLRADAAAMTATDPDLPAAGQPDTLDEAGLRARIASGARLLDASRGMAYRSGHLAGADWVTRARLDAGAYGDPAQVVLTGRCPRLLAGIVAEWRAQTGAAPEAVICGDPARWQAAGLAVEVTPDQPDEAACIDHLFFVHDRHDGNLEAARRYLEWELGLLAQLDPQERGVLAPLRPKTPVRELTDAT